MKRYAVEVFITTPAEEQALNRLVANMNATSLIRLTTEEALASVLYDVLFAALPLDVAPLMDEAHAVLAVDPLLAGMTLTSEASK